MKTYPNNKLTKNFFLYEFIEARMPFEAIAMNWQHIDQFNLEMYEKLALELEKIRKKINGAFSSDLELGEIGLRITSGFRCKEWELFRGRSGNSQHTICAVDLQPINCSQKQAIDIMRWISGELGHTWLGGLALHPPGGKGIGFVHLDTRGAKSRWEYV